MEEFHLNMLWLYILGTGGRVDAEKDSGCRKVAWGLFSPDKEKIEGKQVDISPDLTPDSKLTPV